MYDKNDRYAINRTPQDLWNNDHDEPISYTTHMLPGSMLTCLDLGREMTIIVSGDDAEEATGFLTRVSFHQSDFGERLIYMSVGLARGNWSWECSVVDVTDVRFKMAEQESVDESSYKPI